MAKQTTKSNVKLNQLIKKSKDKEVVLDTSGSLPSGIEDGIAQFSKGYTKLYERGEHKGKPFLYVEGVVVEPKRYKGRRTNKTMKLFETEYNGETTSAEENVDKALNTVKRLGINLASADSEDLLNRILAKNVKKEILFEFRTWSADDSDYVVHIWGNKFEGELEEAEEDVDEGDIDEEMDEEDDGEEDDESEEESDEEEEEGSEEEGDEAEEDLSVLAKVADVEDDEEAQARLQELADEQDIDTDDYETWSDVADALAGVIEEGSEEEEDEKEPTELINIPEKEEVYSYKPAKSRKYHECEVVSVNKTKKTANLKNLATDAKYTAVPWSALKDA